ALGRAGSQFGFSNDAHRNVFRGPSEEVFQNCQMLFEGIDAGIGVEEEFHRREVRFSTSPCGGRVKSSATPANDSAYPSGHSWAGVMITARPWRCTNTMSVSKRNSLGKRTAWLLPVQKTLAFLVFIASSIIHINDTYHVKRCQVKLESPGS